MKYILIVLIILISPFQFGSSVKTNSCVPDYIDVCKILDNISKNIEYIKLHLKEITASEQEECLFKLIDSLNNIFITRNNIQCLIALDSLNSKSDGFLSEYFDEIFKQSFYYNFQQLMLYLYSNDESSIKQSLIWALSLEISMASDKSLKKNEIIEYAKSQIIKTNFSKTEIEFINQIINKMDSTLMD